MENNKTYLQKIPWVALIALLHTLVIFIIIPLVLPSYRTPEDSGSRDLQIIVYNILPVSFYLSLGIVTSNWKAAGIAAAVYVVIQLVYWFLFRNFSKSEVWESYFKQQLIMFFLYALPMLVFAAIHTGLTKRLWLVCGVISFFSIGFSLDTATMGGRNLLSVIDNFDFRDDGWGIAVSILSLLIRIAFYITEVIVFCEIMNLGFGKTYTGKPTLLNLGNDYNKASNIITFWSVKLCLFVVILASAASFAGLMLSLEGGRYGFGDSGSGRKYFLFSSLLRLLSYTGIAIFLAWYIRKFLLETFMNFGIHSKFLYWFSFIPILGFFGFLVVQLENMKQDKYNQKLQSLGTFAASSTAGVTGVIFFLMGLRFIMELVDGNAAFIVSALIGAALFVWLISSKVGYQVSIWLVGSVLFLLLVIGLTSGASRDREYELYSIMFALLLANLVSLIFIYPVYHFEEFQYMPSEDPDPVKPGDPEFSLFP